MIMVGLDWDKINGRKRLEIVEGQTANQVWNDLTNDAGGDFDEKFKEYEKTFPKLLEVNKRLLLGGSENE